MAEGIGGLFEGRRKKLESKIADSVLALKVKYAEFKSFFAELEKFYLPLHGEEIIDKQTFSKRMIQIREATVLAEKVHGRLNTLFGAGRRKVQDIEIQDLLEDMHNADTLFRELLEVAEADTRLADKIADTEEYMNVKLEKLVNAQDDMFRDTLRKGAERKGLFERLKAASPELIEYGVGLEEQIQVALLGPFAALTIGAERMIGSAIGRMRKRRAEAGGRYKTPEFRLGEREAFAGREDVMRGTREAPGFLERMPLVGGVVRAHRERAAGRAMQQQGVSPFPVMGGASRREQILIIAEGIRTFFKKFALGEKYTKESLGFWREIRDILTAKLGIAAKQVAVGTLGALGLAAGRIKGAFAFVAGAIIGFFALALKKAATVGAFIKTAAWVIAMFAGAVWYSAAGALKAVATKIVGGFVLAIGKALLIAPFALAAGKVLGAIGLAIGAAIAGWKIGEWIARYTTKPLGDFFYAVWSVFQRGVDFLKGKWASLKEWVSELFGAPARWIRDTIQKGIDALGWVGEKLFGKLEAPSPIEKPVHRQYGGVVGLRGPELAVVGEGGPELVTPLKEGAPFAPSVGGKEISLLSQVLGELKKHTTLHERAATPPRVPSMADNPFTIKDPLIEYLNSGLMASSF